MYKINGGKELSGTVKIGGSKNAVLPIIAAALLIKGKVVLTNVPEIGDVFTFLEIIEGVGVKAKFENHRLELDCIELKETDFDLEKMKKIRVSILLLAPLLDRLGKISIPTPGGCNLGKRPIDDHIKGLENIGYKAKTNFESIDLKGKTKSGDLELNGGFGVTVTENLLVANVLRKGKTTIKLSAIEPHVINLIDFLRKAGANISIRYDHTIIVEGVEELIGDFEFEVISDYIQSGSYMVMGALSAKDFIIIENARVQDLFFYIQKLRDAGVKLEILENDTVKVYKSDNLKPVNIQTNVFPGFPTDLQSPFAVLMTQAEGVSKIHEVLFEGRLGWLIELEKMGLEMRITNPHEAEITGKAHLVGNTVTSWDLRAGCAVVIAGLLAKGETNVTNIAYIKRGYEDFVKNLQNLGADIEEID
ncbi:MAG: UDP-N-acetylglucosamine 1-carboxyvinyltransferase [Candidatus Gracilibacteria bacterium]|nr:UDP-N-acetylglucosamine 1-carboxyvinyltransferase [Candidatus Gracilibacteria bacterium]